MNIDNNKILDNYNNCNDIVKQVEREATWPSNDIINDLPDEEG